jgi:hypothetical protein
MRGPNNAADNNAALQKQLATSNETLNMFLGGGRQPAWLSGTSPPVASASSLPASRQYKPYSTTPNVTPNDLRNDSSTSTSPCLANTMGMQPPQSHVPATSILPSPSPSEDSIDTNSMTARESAAADQSLYDMLFQASQIQAPPSRKRSLVSYTLAPIKRTRTGENGPPESRVMWTEQPQENDNSVGRHLSGSETIETSISGRLDGPSSTWSAGSLDKIRYQLPPPRDVGLLREAVRPETSSPPLLQQSQPAQSHQSSNQNGPTISPNLTHGQLPSQVASQAPSYLMRRPSQIPLLNEPLQQANPAQQSVRALSATQQEQNFTTPKHQTFNQQQNLLWEQRRHQQMQQQQQQQRHLQQIQQQQRQQQQVEQQQRHQQQIQQQLRHQQQIEQQQQQAYRNQATPNMGPPQQQGQMPPKLPYHKSVCGPKYQAYVTAQKVPFSPIPESRMKVLAEAIESNDMAFLFMHQVLCLYSVDPTTVPQPLRTLPNFDSAVRALDTTLALNSQLEPELVKWFSTFPMPLSEVAMNWLQTYNVGIQTTTRLICGSGTNWNRYHEDCKKRNRPPVASELLNYLGVESPTLMDILFTAVLRSIWGSKDERNPIYPQAQTIFRANRDWFIARLAFGPISEVERVQADNNCIARYNDLYLQMIQNRASARMAGVAQNSPRNALVDQQQMPGLVSDGIVQTPMNDPRNNGIPVANMVLSAQRQPQLLNADPRGPHTLGLQARPPITRLPSQRTFQSTLHPNHSSLRMSQVRPAHGGATSPRLFLPAAGARAPPLPANPTWQASALHQARLRSPDLCQDDILATGPKPMLYQYVKEFALEPKRLELGTVVQRRRFMVSAEMKALIPPTRTSSFPGKPPSRHLTEQSLQFRLRCSKIARPEVPIEEKRWAISDTYWPEYIYLTFNSADLEIRRKLHFGKDLPIDLTDFVIEGENTIHIALNTSPNNAELVQYTFAVEIIGVRNQEMIIGECETRLQPSCEVLSSIKSSLVDDPADDDDIVMVSQNVTVNLFDPISLEQMCNTPVRSKNCVHRHCFDLGTFLESRSRAKPGYPSMVDVWRCPICREDARPQTLLLDGFLMEVRRELVAMGDKETRAIIVQQDGSWTPQPEKKSNHGSRKDTPLRSASISKEPGHSSNPSPAQTPGIPFPNSIPLPNFPFPVTQGRGAQTELEPPPSSKVVPVVDLDSDSD